MSNCVCKIDKAKQAYKHNITHVHTHRDTRLNTACALRTINPWFATDLFVLVGSSLEPVLDSLRSRPSSMFLGDLPLTIQCNILEHCLPSDLAILSRVHSSVRDVAEYALYSHIHYRAQLFKIVTMVPSWESQAVQVLQRLKENKSLLHTFATNPWKASMVKEFYFELDRGDGCDNNLIHFVLVKLVEALEKMPNLVDLRIIQHSPIEDLSKAIISQVIRFVSSRWQS